MKTHITIILFTLIIASCKTGNHNINEAKSPNSNEISDRSRSIDIQKLQGKWRSLDDPRSTRSIQGNKVFDYYEGFEQVMEMTFEIGDNCLNASNNASLDVSQSYMTFNEVDQCFYIIKLDDRDMELSLVGRGNTLRFRRFE